uniref:SDR family oxidoreductase n=1 Tax=Neorhizobium sp. EC2-8 TaxID=3129230 RepID=UPI0031016864
MFSITGNTILITGGGSGIGRALAEAFHAKGNKVIITGRNASKLSAVEKANPGIVSRELDVDDPARINAFAQEIVAEFPDLNVVINNAGIMRAEDLKSGDTDTAKATITTNLLGPIWLNAALLPHLTAKPSATIFMVSSGLAYVPLALTPTYCATKAAIHSYSQTLRAQLKGSTVQLIELVPPYVQTELMGPAQAVDPKAMPLADYISETMRLLEAEPGSERVLVERALFFVQAEREDRYASTFDIINH